MPSRRNLINVVAINICALSVAQAVPWFIIISRAGEWGTIDSNQGLVYTIPAAAVGGVVLFFSFRPLNTHI